MENYLYDEIFELEHRHWWFCAKRNIVLSLIQTYLPLKSENISVCDFGCGCGMMLVELNKSGCNVIGLDSNDLAIEYCKKRGVNAFKYEMQNNQISDETFDCVTLLDVLEHIDDESKVLKEIFRMLKPGGFLICTVPAYQWLWTKRDEFHHHKRRYKKKDVIELFKRGGLFELVKISYMNFLLFPIALCERLIKNRLSPAKQGDLKIIGFGVNTILKKIFTAERVFLKNNISFPFGLSIIAIARKPYERR